MQWLMLKLWLAQASVKAASVLTDAACAFADSVTAEVKSLNGQPTPQRVTPASVPHEVVKPGPIVACAVCNCNWSIPLGTKMSDAQCPDCSCNAAMPMS